MPTPGTASTHSSDPPAPVVPRSDLRHRPSARGTHPAPRGGIAAIGAAAFAVEMAVSGRYGYDRDELYFLECGRHLAWGYVDQPPLTPLVARASSALFANSLVGLRIFPALCLVAIVVMTANMARLLGAARVGQLLAALAAATCPEFLGTMHLLTTTPLDFVFWALTITLVLVLIEREDPRWWIAVGGCVGCAAEAKWNIGFLVGALAVGFLATPSRRLLRGWYLVFGAVLATGLAAPDVIWQAMHGWPAFAVFRALNASAGANRLTYWPAQVLYGGVALAPLVIAGFVRSFRHPEARRWRPVAIAAGLVVVAQFLLGGKPYYPGGAYTYLFAAGAVPIERFIHRPARRRPSSHRDARPVGRAHRTAVGTQAILLSFALSLPVALPVLPARILRLVPLQAVNHDLAETIGWPRLVGLVAHEYDSMPASERPNTAVLTGNYGEAGAIDRYGSSFGLPQAYSGHNNFWLWGPPPPDDRAAVAVDIDTALLRRIFANVHLVAVFENGLGVRDDEEGAPIYVVSGLRMSWAQAWPEFRHYD